MPRRSPEMLKSELDALAGDPAAQSRLAAELIAGERRAQVVGPALAALERFPIPEARPALLQLYGNLDADGVRLDPGGDFRAAALRALRSWATTDDLVLLERAVTTYEFLPPGRSEEAGRIRAAGLVALPDLDPQLAGFHAARLLVDYEHTSRFNGEPARTAAQVLAALSEYLVLYSYTLRDTQRGDVTGECLRYLAGAPDSFVRELCERFGAEANETAQIGLLDMLLARPDRPLFREELRARLDAPGSLAVFRYLAVAMVASRHDELLEQVLAAAEAEEDSSRREALEEALALAPERKLNAKASGQKRKGRKDAKGW
jgi:hypothetical protein